MTAPRLTFLERAAFLRAGVARIREAAEPVIPELVERERAVAILSGREATNIGTRVDLPCGGRIVLLLRRGAGPALDIHLVHGGEGTIPPPDPVLSLAGALHTEELCEEARLAFDAAVAWCEEALD